MAPAMRSWLIVVPAMVSAMLLCAPVVTAQTEPAGQMNCVIEPYETAHVASPVEGVIEALHVERNDEVKAGQVLAELKADVEKASVALHQARTRMTAELELRRATLAFERRNLGRIDELYGQQAIPLHVRDEVKTDAVKSQHQLNRAREELQLAALELAKAQAVLEMKRVRSPLDGVVLERYASVGEFVSEDPILKVAQLDPLMVEVIVPVELFGTIEPGMIGEVVPELPNAGVHTATVTMVDRAVDAASGTFDVRLELPNPDRAIASGLSCRVKFSPAPAGSPSSNGAPSPQAPTRMDLRPKHSGPPGASLMVDAGDVGPAQSGEAFDLMAFDSKAGPLIEAPPPETGPPLTICRLVGPIGSNEQVERIGEALMRPGILVVAHERADSIVDSYMVLTGGPASKAETRALQKRLRKAGIDDQMIIPRGINKGWISLGVYHSKGWAERRQNEIAALGFTSHVAARTKTLTRHWLEVRLSAEEADELEILRTAEQFVSDSELKLSPCPVALTQLD